MLLGISYTPLISCVWELLQYSMEYSDLLVADASGKELLEVLCKHPVTEVDEDRESMLLDVDCRQSQTPLSSSDWEGSSYCRPETSGPVKTTLAKGSSIMDVSGETEPMELPNPDDRDVVMDEAFGAVTM